MQVGSELKALVFDRVFPGLAGGFVTDAVRRGERVTADQVHEATLSFLYKLLFLLYAEARNLLPIDRDYRDYSLIKLTHEVAQGIERQKKLKPDFDGDVRSPAEFVSNCGSRGCRVRGAALQRGLISL